MRLFIAIPLPPDIRRAAECAQTALISAGAEGRFVPSKNFHLTLHFIGESGDLSGAATAMRDAVRDIRPFVLRLQGYGSFGGKNGRTVFVSVGGDLDELNSLYESLESALWEQGFTQNRGRLTPHITLGRNVTKEDGFLLPHQTAAFTADSIVLYESRPNHGQMQYLVVHKEKLS
ncbi:MAG: RNA 2',3'-cyclic phosphodiesterase [Clostridia bacterium]